LAVLRLSRLKLGPAELKLSTVVYNDVGVAPGWYGPGLRPSGNGADL
jgi:hypothetical protein